MSALGVIAGGVLLFVILGLSAFACYIIGGKANDGPDDLDWDV